jgi:N-acetylmuramoyl-L-alanine amidase
MRNFCQFVVLAAALAAATSSPAKTAPKQAFSVDPPTTVSTRKGPSSAIRHSTIVVIDAGHGGFDPGGIPGQRVPEKTMTLDVALRLRSLLEKSGYHVIMTRDRDVFVPLPQRVAIANAYPDAIFICIHFNSATRSGANGIETYFYSRDSLALASAIHYHLAGDAPSPNRGVRRRGYYVLRKTRIPAVLVECGFLTNPWEARNVENSGYRQRLAENIAQGIQGRSAVAARPSSTRLVAEGTIPLQPFIDQTRVHDPDISRSKRSRKSSKRKSSTRKSSETKSEGELASTKKKTAPRPSED